MQGIYTYIPETNYVPREYSVAAILLLLFTVLISLVPVLNLLYFYISTFRSMCAVNNMAVFCSSLTSCFPGTLHTYFLNDFEIVPVAPVITGITFVFTFHMRCISVVRSLYFRILSASFLVTFLYYYYLLSPLCGEFTIIYLGYIVLQSFCTFTLACPAVCVGCPIWLFSIVSWFRASPVCCSGICWMIQGGSSCTIVTGITFVFISVVLLLLLRGMGLSASYPNPHPAEPQYLSLSTHLQPAACGWLYQ